MAKKKRVPASPSGRIGRKRPANRPLPPGKRQPQEIAKEEPDARFGDERLPESDAREQPDGVLPPSNRDRGYKNTDEDF
jgi:hypothetical protein